MTVDAQQLPRQAAIGDAASRILGSVPVRLLYYSAEQARLAEDIDQQLRPR